MESFFLKEGYKNAGVFLYNLKKWREMDIYNDLVKFYKYLNFTHRVKTAHQDFITLNCHAIWKTELSRFN